MTYLILGLDVGPSIEEEGDGGILAVASSQMERGQPILPHTDRQTDRQVR